MVLHEKEFKVFLDNGFIFPHNNLAESFCRKIKMIKNNSLFSKKDKGAESVGIYLSIVETCKLNGLNVERYLKYCFENADKLKKNAKDFIPTAKLPKELYVTKKEYEEMKEENKALSEEESVTNDLN